MKREFLSAQQEKKKKVAEESTKAKEKYMKFVRSKLQDLYTEQAQSLIDASNKKEEKKNELKSLEEEEMKLL